MSGIFTRYRLRWLRRRWRFQAYRRRRDLYPVRQRTHGISGGDVLLFATLRNERIRMPYFLSYYRALGIGHFLIVDNASDDGTREYLAAQPDVSLWTTGASYKRARYGMDWINGLLSQHGHGHWCLVVDADEFFVYPYSDTRPIRALTDWLDASSVRSFSAMLLDMYPKGPMTAQPYAEGQDPFEIAQWFDTGNYTFLKNELYGNLWIQGGPRARVFFADDPEKAPALNKIPLVHWDRSFVYARSTHMLLPRGLNFVYDAWGGEKASGILMHAKFLDILAAKTDEEMRRGQHFASSTEYRAYKAALDRQPDLWCKWSERYINWRQLEILGLMSKGNWA